MKKEKLLGILAFALVFGLIVAGCQQEPEAAQFSNDAGLKSISLNGEAGQMAEGVTQANWDDGNFDFTTMPLSHLYASDDAALTNATIEAKPANSAASIYYGIGSDIEGPQTWSKDGNFSLLNAANDYVYIRITSESRKARFYYKARIHIKSSIASLSLLMVSGRVASINDTASSTTAPLDATPVNLIIEYQTDSVNAPVTYVKQDEGQVIQMASRAFDSTDEPVFGDETTFTFGDGDDLFVKTTSSDGTVTRYYWINMVFTNLLSAVTIGSKSADLIGFGQNAVNVGTTGGFRGAIGLTSAEAAVGAVVTAIPAAGSGATVTGYAIAASTSTNPTIVAATDGAYTTIAVISNNQHLFIRVAGRTGDLYYYRIVITVVSNNAALTAITVGGAAAYSLGTPAATWNDSGLVEGSAILSPAQISAGNVAISVTKSQTNSVTAYAYTANGTTQPVFSDSSTIPVVAVNGYIWVRSVAQDGQTTFIYKLKITNAGPFTITVAGIQLEWASMGVSWTSGTLPFASMGSVVLTETAAASLTISAGGTSGGDTVTVIKYTVPATQANVAIGDFTSATASLTGSFKGKDIIQVCYTPSGGSPRYYAIYIRRTADIPYVTAGTIDVTTDGTASESAWSTAPTLSLDRVYAGDSAGWSNVTDFDADAPSTVKVLWSDDGIYYFATVYDTTSSLGDDHQCDNLEFFLSEDYTLGATGNWNTMGGQYRVGRNDNVSGDNTGRVTKMVTEVSGGYTIKARIAWGTAGATVATWNNKLIGIDPQLAYSRSSGSRDGVVMWSNFLAGSYGQKGNTGLAYLKRP